MVVTVLSIIYKKLKPGITQYRNHNFNNANKQKYTRANNSAFMATVKKTKLKHNFLGRKPSWFVLSSKKNETLM